MRVRVRCAFVLTVSAVLSPGLADLYKVCCAAASPRSGEFIGLWRCGNRLKYVKTGYALKIAHMEINVTSKYKRSLFSLSGTNLLMCPSVLTAKQISERASAFKRLKLSPALIRLASDVM